LALISPVVITSPPTSMLTSPPPPVPPATLTRPSTRMSPLVVTMREPPLPSPPPVERRYPVGPIVTVPTTMSITPPLPKPAVEWAVRSPSSWRCPPPVGTAHDGGQRLTMPPFGPETSI
jgi:hypothetical protein